MNITGYGVKNPQQSTVKIAGAYNVETTSVKKYFKKTEISYEQIDEFTKT